MKQKQLPYVMCGLVLAALATTPVLAGKIKFFEGGDGSQDNVGTISSDEKAEIDFKKSDGLLENDEARSVRIWYASPGTITRNMPDTGATCPRR